PVLYIGGGVIKSEAHSELRTFAEANDIPVVTTLMALGAYPESHELHMDMPGMHGSVPAVAALQRSDLLIAIGTRFDDRATGKLESFAPNAKVIHADIDPAEIGKIREVQVPIVGDAKEVLAALHKAIDTHGLSRPDTTEWREYLGEMKEHFPRGYEHTPNEKMAPQFVIETHGLARPYTTEWREYLGEMKEHFPRGYEHTPTETMPADLAIQPLSK